MQTQAHSFDGSSVKPHKQGNHLQTRQRHKAARENRNSPHQRIMLTLSSKYGHSTTGAACRHKRTASTGPTRCHTSKEIICKPGKDTKRHAKNRNSPRQRIMLALSSKSGHSTTRAACTRRPTAPTGPTRCHTSKEIICKPGKDTKRHA